MPHSKSPDGRHSWLVAVTGAFASIFTFGTPYSFGVFLRYFAPRYAIPEIMLSSIFSFQLFMFFVGGGILGALVSNVSTRAVLVAGVAILVSLSPALFVTHSGIALAVIFGTLGVVLGVVYVVLASTVPNWFDEYRGTGTGLLFAGNGLSLFLLPPAWNYAFATLGVETGFFAFVIITALPILLAAAICHDPPWMERDGTSGADLYAWIARVWDRNDFTYPFVGVAFSIAWYSLLPVYALDLFQARGLGESTASLAFGFIGGISILSRLGSGIIADRIGYYNSFLLSLGSAGLGAILLFAPTLPTSMAAVVLFGIGLGGAATLYIPVLMETFDPNKSTAVIGIFTTAFGVTSLVLPPIGTAILSRTNSFTPIIAFTLGTILFGIYCWTKV